LCYIGPHKKAKICLAVKTISELIRKHA
jgi:hypothetical protein